MGNTLSELRELSDRILPGGLGLQEVREALSQVASTIQEVRDEVADHLRAHDAKEWIDAAIKLLEPLKGDNELGRVVHAAIQGLQAGVDWLEGGRDLRFFDTVVEVVSFGMQVQNYIANGHFLGDLGRAGEQLLRVSVQTMARGSQ